MISVFTFFFILYISIVILAAERVIVEYKMRQLVKANFWINVAIFALLAILTLIILIEFYFGL